MIPLLTGYCSLGAGVNGNMPQNATKKHNYNRFTVAVEIKLNITQTPAIRDSKYRCERASVPNTATRAIGRGTIILCRPNSTCYQQSKSSKARGHAEMQPHAKPPAERSRHPTALYRTASDVAMCTGKIRRQHYQTRSEQRELGLLY